MVLILQAPWIQSPLLDLSFSDMDPTRICTGKGAVTLRASSSYREIPSSSPVSPQETPKQERKTGVLLWRPRGRVSKVGGRGIHWLPPDSQGPLHSLLLSPLWWVMITALNEQVLTGFRQSDHCILAFDGMWAVCTSADCVQEDREGLGVSGRSAETASRLGFSEPIPTSGSSAVTIHVGLGLEQNPRETEKCRWLSGLISSQEDRELT